MKAKFKAVRITDILNQLDTQELPGLQVTLAQGMLRSTKAIFRKKKKYYLYGMDEDWRLKPSEGCSREELTQFYENTWWIIDMPIA